VLEMLSAVGTLLAAVKGAACFSQIAVAQRLSIENVLAVSKIDVAEAARIVVHLQAMPWEPGDLNALLEAVGRASSSGPADTSPAGKLQNFECFQEYFAEGQWDVFLDRSASHEAKTELVLVHLSSMGLRFPTECTTQRIVGFHLATTLGFERAAKLPPQAKLDLVRFFKKKIKEYGKSPPAATVSKLPSDAATFERMYPTLALVAFADGRPCKCKLDPAALQALVQSVPMRSTHKATKETVQPAACPMDFLLKLMQHMTQPNSEIPIKFLQAHAPKRSSSLLTLPAPTISLDDEDTASSPAPVSRSPSTASPITAPSPAPTPSWSSHLPLPETDKAEATNKKGNLGVDATTELILAGLQSRDAAKKKVAAEKKGKKAGLPTHSKAAASKGTAEKKGRKAGLPTHSKAAAAKPMIGVEWSRSQVMARTGEKGPGTNKAFKFAKESGMPEAKRLATKWLRDQGCRI